MSVPHFTMFTPLVLVVVASYVLHCVVATQTPFSRQTSYEVPLIFANEQYDAGLFSPPFLSLSALPESEWAILSHPLHPKYSVRVKKTKFCDDTVKCASILS